MSVKKYMALVAMSSLLTLAVPPSVQAQSSNTASLGPSIFQTPTELQLAHKPKHFGRAPQHMQTLFPTSWNQLQANQQHDPVFQGPAGSHLPSILAHGGFWVAPLTGDEFLRLGRAFDRYPQDGGQAWGAEAAQWLGNVTGVSLVDGIVYIEESNNQIFAVNALTGVPIWRTQSVNSDMGDAIATSINGRPILFVGAGDVGFTLQHAVDFANNGNPPGPTVRGANFSAVYAIDGLTGKVLWRFDTAGEAMPTPVYHNGVVFFNTGDGHLYAVNAQNGQLLSAFSNPGFSSMSSGNWYIPTQGPYKGQFLMIYGTQDPNYLMAVDETNPQDPHLAWEYQVPNSINTGLGDVPPVVDPKRGIVLTDALVNDVAAGGTTSHPILNLDIFALNANTGQLLWSHLGGNGLVAKPVAFKGSVPMVHGGNLYVGDLLNETYQSYNEKTGRLRWETSIAQSGEVNEPRAGGVYYDHRVLFAEGQHIYTLNPKTGAIVNKFSSHGYFFGVWGISSPVIVDNELYIGSISGWIFAAPAHYIMTHRGGVPAIPNNFPSNLSVPDKAARYDNPLALPTPNQAANFPSVWEYYAGGTDHEGYSSIGPSGVKWATPLNDALPLNSPPRDTAIFGPHVASEMTSLAFGVGSGVSPAQGIVYAGSSRYSVNALNATTGQLIWRFDTINANAGQPLVTPNAVIESSGDPWFNFAAVQDFAKNSPAVHIGASFQNIHALNPKTGREMWTFYTRGTDAMTPLYYQGTLYWVDGSGNVWAINAQNGTPVKPFVDSSGNPVLHLSGFNTQDSATMALTSQGPIMVVGTSTPDVLYGINLDTAQILWKQTFSSTPLQYSGFAFATPVYDAVDHLVISDVLVNPHGNQATLEAFAVNPLTGHVVWSQTLGTGSVPDGFGGSTPVFDPQTDSVFFGNPLTHSEIGLNAVNGHILWNTRIGQDISAPGAVVSRHLIVAGGPDIFSLNPRTGRIQHTTVIGGDFLNNNPTIEGQTVYIGNAWGWVLALPLNEITG
ncbi:PQQ-binding-like beta-propeller repeat protein [Sulfobacillus thermosulfidooxidans]|uniref:outer membrane protein assembly factor BamB family protein n=1 Tax=Sulfobacillus thermosulfidooxidans TaxID=28034 RepID=UPI0002E6A539|nr:PQQ-binding-like beta-propeller repeat protein [Sulfobacillus thermosulfidooxidans]